VSQSTRPSWRLSGRALDLLALGGLLLLAAILRLPDLATRGTWDGDQGHDMLVVRALLRDGVVPLLGPPTSIGDFHHGALYYYLLAPFALSSGGDSPLPVVAFIALAGIAAVGVTWWLARSIGGPLAGLAAGLLMAVSIAAIDESTFLWNPNLIQLSSAIALAAAWRAWSTERARWWLLAAAATAVTIQLHVLALVFVPIVAALLVADIRRAAGHAERRGALLRVTVGAVVIIAISYLPLVANELTTNFSESRAVWDYLVGGGRETSDVNPIARPVIAGLRIVTWPLVGLIVDAGAVALLAAAVVVALTVWLARGPASDVRTAARWLGLGLVWSTVALGIAAPSLASVVRGLPNDHYHAFADPMVFTLVGLGTARLWSWRGRLPSRRPEDGPALPNWAGPLVAVILVGGLVAWNVTHLPPGRNRDGGFPVAEDAAVRIGRTIDDRPTALRSIPPFKSTEAYAYPLHVDGRNLVSVPTQGDDNEAGRAEREQAERDATALVVICDDLFETVTGAACGGPAEAIEVPPGSPFGSPVDQWEASPGRWISVYVADPGQ
jgi:4-amino-4-deoxy-L-arabinose transferase-like glycosyltransferase